MGKLTFLFVSEVGKFIQEERPRQRNSKLTFLTSNSWEYLTISVTFAADTHSFWPRIMTHYNLIVYLLFFP